MSLLPQILNLNEELRSLIASQDAALATIGEGRSRRGNYGPGGKLIGATFLPSYFFSGDAPFFGHVPTGTTPPNTGRP